MFFLLSCALPSVSAAFTQVDDPIGPAWAAEADPSFVVAVADDPDGVWAPGLYVRHGAHLAAHFAPAPALADAAWIPPVLGLPRDPPRLDEPGLALDVVGGDGNGCDDALVARVEPRFTRDGVEVDVALDGVPALALPAEGIARVDGADHDLAAVTAWGLLVEDVAVVETDDLAITFLDPVPLLRFVARDGYVAVDVDAACARVAGWTGEAVVSFSL
ncbi:MAG: hypothetical protein ACOZNI_07290 [Myxococcota bacterium]